MLSQGNKALCHGTPYSYAKAFPDVASTLRRRCVNVVCPRGTPPYRKIRPFISKKTYWGRVFGGNSGPEVLKLFSCSTQLSMKFVLLINPKLLRTANSSLLHIAEHENFSANEYEKANYFGIFIFISRENFMLSWVEHEKSFLTTGSGTIFPVLHKNICCGTHQKRLGF